MKSTGAVWSVHGYYLSVLIPFRCTIIKTKEMACYGRILEELPRVAIEHGYPWEQRKGQRHFGPLPGWLGPPPKGTEVFVGKIPRDSDEDELFPLLSQAGKIYNMRIMMDFSGSNRGYAFVRFTRKSEAKNAVKMFNGYLLRGEKRIGVSLSVDNSRLFIGSLPKTATKDEIFREFRKIVKGLVDVIMYPNPKNLDLNRGFAFLEFDCHQSAAAARRELIPCPETPFGRLNVDWAEPEPVVDEEIMNEVKILYVRNLNLRTTESDLCELFNSVIVPAKVQRVKKINDYAFIHLSTRAEAEKAFGILDKCTLDDLVIDIQWARPVEDKLLYKAKKMINKGIVDESILYTSNRGLIYPDASQNTASSSSDHRYSAAFPRQGLVGGNNFINRNNTNDICVAANDSLNYQNDNMTTNGVYNQNNIAREYDRNVRINDNFNYYNANGYPLNSNETVYNRSRMNADYGAAANLNTTDYHATDVTNGTGLYPRDNAQFYGTRNISRTGSAYQVQNYEDEDIVTRLENICASYKWSAPTYEVCPNNDGYYCLITLCIGLPFNANPICIGPLVSTYTYSTTEEAKNDAARNAVNYIHTMWNFLNNKTVSTQSTIL